MEKVEFNKKEKVEISRRVRKRTKARFSKFHGDVRKSVLVAVVGILLVTRFLGEK